MNSRSTQYPYQSRARNTHTRRHTQSAPSPFSVFLSSRLPLLRATTYTFRCRTSRLTPDDEAIPESVQVVILSRRSRYTALTGRATYFFGISLPLKHGVTRRTHGFLNAVSLFNAPGVGFLRIPREIPQGRFNFHPNHPVWSKLRRWKGQIS